MREKIVNQKQAEERCNVVRSEERRSRVKNHRWGRVLILLCPLMLAMVFTSRESLGQTEEPTVEPVARPKVPDALKLHREAIVVDGHVHLTNCVFHQGIDPWKTQITGTFDYARAKEGGLDVAIEHLYIDDSYNRYNYAVKQACRLIETFHRVVDSNPDKMELAVDSQDIRRIVADGKLAVVLALEGGIDMEGDLDVLRLFHRLGVRMIQITNHDTTNALTDAGRGEKWGGISPKGRAVIQEMNRLGIVIDISHASPEAKRQIIEASQAPVVTSHNGLQHFSSSMGNISDKTLRDLAAKGGLMGLHSAGWILQQKSLDWGYYRPRGSPPPEWAKRASLKFEFFRPPIDYGEYITQLDSLNRDLWLYRYGYGEPWRVRQRRAILQGAPLPTVEDWANQVDYVVGLVGAEHIALGLDLMSGGHWLRDFDATDYPRITEALVARGYSSDTVRKILGENWLRLLSAAKVPPQRRTGRTDEPPQQPKQEAR